VETYGFNVDKIVEILEIDSEINKLFLKMVLKMNELGIKTERQELDEKLHNLAMRGVNEQR
jgi:hypothetical protein